ncbi:MAG: hypothetical protein LLG13_12490 [Bacteroidales bacterium]|nr:hypothetical protein [Bacteroidales bacterium]
MKRLIILYCFLIAAAATQGQNFEESAGRDENNEKPKVHVGGDFAMQFQFLKHHADSLLIPLGRGLNLPTANLNLQAVLADGIEANLTTYLSSRHHVEAWVKGGYLLIDKLPFINSKVISDAMNFLTFKIGVMELNYGDAHFRRSDNGNVINNMFVGNYIMDAFTTAPAFEALYRNKGILLMGAVTTGTLDPVLVGYNSSSKKYTPYYIEKELAFYWKAGYDNQINDNLRIRATLSGYHSSNNHSGSLYFGDRTGSRYYLVMNRVKYSPDDVDPAKNHMSGNWGPGFTDRDNSLMINLFTKYKGVEFFGTFENVKGTPAFGGSEFKLTQYAIESLLHFGKDEKFFGGARYNYTRNNLDDSVDRIQIGCGWFITPGIMVKAEYVDQNYKNFSLYGNNAGFNGLMIESTVSF